MRRSLPHQIVVSIDLAVEEEDSRTSQEFMVPHAADCRGHNRRHAGVMKELVGTICLAS